MRFIVDASARGRCLVAGPDAPAFLHRMCTQHVKDLAKGEARLSVLTNDKGRIVDVVHHVVLDDGIALLGQRVPQSDLFSWLDRFFFTEQLTLSSLPEAAAVLVDEATAETLVSGAGSLAPWESRQKGAVFAVRTFDVAARDGAVVSVVLVVSRDPVASPLPPATMGLDDFLAAALAAGVPTLEVSEAFTPLDLALHDAIHWAKGCYIGQEVIARLDTYKKQRKVLAGVVGEPAKLAVGDAVFVDGVAVGTVTSSATLPWCASLPSALAVVTTTLSTSSVAAVVRGASGDIPVQLVARRAAQAPHD